MGLKVNGVTVGSLDEAHAWAEANRPAAVTIDAGDSVVPMAHGLTWRYSAPLTLNGGTYTGLQGDEGRRGWWLVYQPSVPAATRWRPVRMPLVLNGVTVEGFVRGGLNIAPKTGSDPNAGGEVTFLAGTEVNGCTFRKIGTRWSSDDSNAAVGYGAIFGQGLAGLKVAGSVFEDLVNDELSPRVANTFGASLIHALYLDDYCTAEVSGSAFRRISGDAIRVRNGSSVKVAGSRFERAGWRANVSSWRNVAAGEARGTATMIAGNVTDGLTYGGGRARLWDPYR